MSLKERLLQDWKSALKSKDVLRKSTITMVRAAILQKEKDEHIVLDDEQVIGIIAKEVKQRKDSIPDFEKGDRPDLVERLGIEIDILTEYLPKQLLEDEVEDIVILTIADVGANSMKDMGKVMGAVMPKVKGRADGRIVNKLVQKHLR